MDTKPLTSERRPDLDALRVGAILLLHLYHSARLFNVDDPWHLKAPQLLAALNGPMDVLHLLRMPLLMLIAGIGTAYALKRRTVGAFFQDRTKRLLWPLIFGMFLIIPPQIYIERIYTGQFQGSYASFYSSVFQFVTYPKGSLSWHHLWFVAYLFVFSILALPLFGWLNGASGQTFLRKAEALLGKGVNLWLLFIPLALVRILLRNYPETHALIGDHKVFAYYGLLFLIGHLMGRCPALWDRLVAMRWQSLGVTAVWFAIMVQPWEFPFPFEHFGTYAFVWWTLLTVMGFARKGITVSKPWMTYAQNLTYPFYIFHQTVIVVLGWWLVRLPLGPWASFGLITLLTFLASWGLSEGVSRVAWLRPCFGLALQQKPSHVAPQEAPSLQLAPILTDESR